uniref:DBF4-type domain-containing protein n=1 Tax=Mycena chlorophos TaxID=658473 RepID=A0ABQ0M322_MYCCL|nr:predicted protein [Mycena chlorophos]
MATLRRTQPPLRQPQKRPRSPDHAPVDSAPKRLKGSAAQRDKEPDKDKARRHTEREQQRLEFKDKYSRAFPGWKFYIDVDNMPIESASVVKQTQAKIRQLGGSIESFFSNDITHFITFTDLQQTTTTTTQDNNKENDMPRSRLRSPIKLRGQNGDDLDLLSKAKTFENTKIWPISKLNSVLDRCLDPGPTASGATAHAATSALAPQRSLSRLLQSERLHGTTERDPTQRRHDHKYFNRNTYFLLVEDLKEELAPIAIQEYVIPKGREAQNAKVPWPVLYCHPQSRGPFLQFDERERKRWEKTQRMEMEEADEREAHEKERMQRMMKRSAEAHWKACNQAGDLRRSASMNNMHRRALEEQQMVDLDGEVYDSAHPGGNVAASGNSVGITSTTGTTSTTGLALLNSLPPALRGRPEVITSRKSAILKPVAAAAAGEMGPPAVVPGRLKKSRSTNTIRLPKREEGSKPGYCESCRTKFDDFNKHVQGKRHRNFAADDGNFLELDMALARVKRITQEETRYANEEWKRKCAERYSANDDEDDEDDQLLLRAGDSSDYENSDGGMVDLDSD